MRIEQCTGLGLHVPNPPLHNIPLSLHLARPGMPWRFDLGSGAARATNCSCFVFGGAAARTCGPPRRRDATRPCPWSRLKRTGSSSRGQNWHRRETYLMNKRANGWDGVVTAARGTRTEHSSRGEFESKNYTSRVLHALGRSATSLARWRDVAGARRSQS